MAHLRGREPDWSACYAPCAFSVRLGLLPAWQLAFKGQEVKVASPLKAWKAWLLSLLSHSVARSCHKASPA